MNEEYPMDTHLKGYADKYAEWRKSGSFTFSSRIIPVQESLASTQWVLPQEQVLRFLREARSIALTNCICRTHYHRCDRPRDVCLLLDELADKTVASGKARKISMDEVSERLREADKYGLIHMALYMPDHKIYALCSCCACCCHDLQLLLQYHRVDLVARSDYVADTDISRCSSCELCIERCVFGARKVQDGVFVYDPCSCLGCGLCVSVCPENATGMKKREIITTFFEY